MQHDSGRHVFVDVRCALPRECEAVRLTVVNITGSNDFNAVINIIDAPNFLMFSGGQARAFTGRPSPCGA